MSTSKPTNTTQDKDKEKEKEKITQPESKKQNLTLLKSK